MHLYLYLWTCVHNFKKDIGIHEEKEICLQNREYISGNWCDRTNMAAKCKLHEFSKKFIGIYKKQVWLPKNTNKCEGTIMALKCKLIETVNLTLYGHSYFVYINMCTILRDCHK